MSILILLLRRRLGGLGGTSVPRAMLQGGLGTLAMALVLQSWLALTAAQGELLRLAGGAVLGVAIYAAVMLALRVPEIRSVLLALRARFEKKPVH